MSTIKTLTELHPEAVVQLFRAYGYDMEPTERNLNNLVTVHGNKPFPLSSVNGEPNGTLNSILSKGLELLSVLKTGKIPVKQDYSQPDGTTPRIFGINKTIFIMLAVLTVIVLVLILFRKK